MHFKAFAVTLTLAVNLAACSSGTMNSNTSGDGSSSAPSFSQFSDLPVPARASMNVSETLLLGNGENWTGRLVYTTWKDQTTIYDFYKAQMPGFGWQEITSVRASISVQTWSRDTRVCTIQIKDTLLGSEVIATMAPAGSGGAMAPAPAAAPQPVVKRSNLQ